MFKILYIFMSSNIDTDQTFINIQNAHSIIIYDNQQYNKNNFALNQSTRETK